MLPSPCRSRAIAAHTHESIPPLNSTTAFRASDFLVSMLMLSPKICPPPAPRPGEPPILYFTLPLSPDPTQICVTAIPVAPADRPPISTPPASAPRALSTSRPDHQTPAKTKPAAPVPQADAAP